MHLHGEVVSMPSYMWACFSVLPLYYCKEKNLLVLICVRWWRPYPRLLQGVQLLRHLLHPAAVDQLMQVQVGAAVGALWPLLCQPAADAQVTTQLGAVRAQVGVLQLLHADEAPEHLSQALQ